MPPPSVAAGASSATPWWRARRAGLALVALLLAGTAARAGLLSLAPTHGFTGDHIDYVCWGRHAVASGILALYTAPPPQCPAEVATPGGPQIQPAGSEERLNYPALAAYVFWLQGALHAALDPAATANTPTARAVYATSTTLAELLTAWGTAAIVQTFAGPGAALAAFGLTWVAPPLLLDGAFWGQTESWVLAPAVWMLLAMMRGRWLAAGALWGLALAAKPSGVLFAPVWLYALLFRPARGPILAGGILGAAVPPLLALPFWIDSGAAWLRATYLDNYVFQLHWTTVMAFNVWYADLLLTGVRDSRTPLLGVSRDLWGVLLLGLGLATAFALARRWEGRHPARQPPGVLLVTTLVTLAAVTLPTRVHSTYGAFTTPFLIATVFLVPRATLAVAGCLAAVSVQILSWQWANLLAVHVLDDESIFPPAIRAERRAMRARDRPREWALTVVSVGAAAGVAAAVAAAARAERAPRGAP